MVPVLVAEKVGTVPFTGFELASNKVTVMVDAVIPSDSTGPEPVMVLVVIDAEPWVKVTVPPVDAPGVTMARVLTSALVELKVQVDTPDAEDEEHDW